jgi:hypothetical protein
MIIVQLLGGMGNQMFQYALGRHLSVKNGVPLKLDTSILLDWKPRRHLVNRDFDLDIFRLDPLIASKKEIAAYNPQLMTSAEKIYFHLKRKLGIRPACKEKAFSYDPHVLQLTGTQYLAGLWQSYKYFEDIEELIREDFQLRNDIGAYSAPLLHRIQQANAVCINVRRTDYVDVKQTADVMGFTGPNYYKDALSALTARVSDPHIFVFSDDIEWCRGNLQTGHAEVTFVDHAHAGKKFSDYFRLMIACKHFIIPNSTFGWWAAWLSGYKDKVVIAPKKWMNDPATDTADLIPPSWIRL